MSFSGLHTQQQQTEQFRLQFLKIIEFTNSKVPYNSMTHTSTDTNSTVKI